MPKLAAMLPVAVIGSACFAGPAQAGPFADDLSRCLVRSTTEADRTNLVRWFFIAASKHPAVAPISSVEPNQLDAGNRDVAALFMRLLTETCVEQARQALKFEGPTVFETSFQVLGEVAGQELFSHADVNAGIMGMASYLDEQKLNTVLGIPQ
jgi:hypothetical protein